MTEDHEGPEELENKTPEDINNLDPGNFPGGGEILDRADQFDSTQTPGLDTATDSSDPLLKGSDQDPISEIARDEISSPDDSITTSLNENHQHEVDFTHEHLIPPMQASRISGIRQVNSGDTPNVEEPPDEIAKPPIPMEVSDISEEGGESEDSDTITSHVMNMKTHQNPLLLPQSRLSR